MLVQHRAPARMPPQSTQDPTSLKWRLLNHMMSNTDHFLPIRASAEGYQPLISPQGPLHHSRLRTVSGFFSMGTFRGTTYHSEFAKQNTTFQDATDFLQKVFNLPTPQFVIADCYGGRAQRSRVTSYHDHAHSLWQTVQKNTANWWLLRTPPATQQTPHAIPGDVGGTTHDGPSMQDASVNDPSTMPPSSSPGVPTSTCQPPGSDSLLEKPKYEEILDLILSKDHDFPLLGPLTAHLLVADYVDAGVVEPPDAETMARVICRIDAGALAGLRALDYFHNRDALRYVKERAFMDLYAYLDNEFTPDEKRRLNWGPICLEHGLCKYSRFAKHQVFGAYFLPTHFSSTELH